MRYGKERQRIRRENKSKSKRRFISAFVESGKSMRAGSNKFSDNIVQFGDVASQPLRSDLRSMESISQSKWWAVMDRLSTAFVSVVLLTLMLCSMCIGIDHAGLKDMAERRAERITQLSFRQLGEVQVLHESAS